MWVMGTKRSKDDSNADATHKVHSSEGKSS